LLICVAPPSRQCDQTQFYLVREFTRQDNVKKRIRVDRVMKAFSFLAEASLKKKFNVR